MRGEEGQPWGDKGAMGLSSRGASGAVHPHVALPSRGLGLDFFTARGWSFRESGRGPGERSCQVNEHFF